jgi:serine/threonine protein kinase
VKRLGKKSEQGITELMSEVVSLAKLQHKYLVRIVGVCVEESEKLIVFEYLPNSSLDKHIYGNAMMNG